MATPDRGAQDVIELVRDLSRRMSRVEQRRALSYDADGRPRFPDGISIGDGGNETPVTAGPVDPVTGLALVIGALYDEIFIDAEWTLPADTTGLRGVEVVLLRVTNPGGGETRTIVGVQRLGLIESLRIRPLEPQTVYDVEVYVVDRLGRSSAGTVARTTTGVDTVAPPQAAGLTLIGAQTSLVARWTESVAVDVARGEGVYEVELSRKLGTGGAFAVVDTRRTAGTILAFTDQSRDNGAGPPATDYYYRARVRAIDKSGNAGAWSSNSSEVRLGDSQDGVIASDSIVVAGLDAAVIRFGTMSGDRLSVNTLDANRIKASNLVVTLGITTGRLQVGSGPGATGVYIDSSGIRLYKAAVRKVFLDAATGDAEFKGTIVAEDGEISGDLDVSGTFTLSGAGGAFKSSTSGKRVEIDTGDRLVLYAGAGGVSWALDSDAGSQTSLDLWLGRADYDTSVGGILLSSASGGPSRLFGTAAGWLVDDAFKVNADVTIANNGRLIVREIDSGEAWADFKGSTGGDVLIAQLRPGPNDPLDVFLCLPTNTQVALMLDSSADEIVARTRGDLNYRAMRASAFNVASSAELKVFDRAIPKATIDAVFAAEPRKWKWRKNEGDGGAAWHYGPYAEALPGDVCGDDGYSISDLLGLTMAATRVLRTEVASLRAVVARIMPSSLLPV